MLSNHRTVRMCITPLKHWFQVCLFKAHYVQSQYYMVDILNITLYLFDSQRVCQWACLCDWVVPHFQSLHCSYGFIVFACADIPQFTQLHLQSTVFWLVLYLTLLLYLYLICFMFSPFLLLAVGVSLLPTVLTWLKDSSLVLLQQPLAFHWT